MKTVSVASNKQYLAYIGLAFVVLVWGCNPLITLQFYKYYSPTIRITFTALVCALMMLLIARNNLKLLDKSYFIVAIPTGFFMAIANIAQKIGLQYTTPSHYAFLENLSCIVVPVLMFFFVKKKPELLTVIAALLCLLSSFVLSGMSADMDKVHWSGDLLCALAGIFYGVNIAGTGAFAKKLYAPLYLTIQMFTEMTVSLIGAIVFDVTGIEKIMFSFDWRLMLGIVLIGLVSSTLCWLIRTNAMKQVDAATVAIISPFSAVITMILSVLTGNDTLSVSLVTGASLGLIAIILSGLGDRSKQGNEKMPSR